MFRCLRANRSRGPSPAPRRKPDARSPSGVGGRFTGPTSSDMKLTYTKHFGLHIPPPRRHSHIASPLLWPAHVAGACMAFTVTWQETAALFAVSAGNIPASRS
jgi:hypothetical protein